MVELLTWIGVLAVFQIAVRRSMSFWLRVTLVDMMNVSRMASEWVRLCVVRVADVCDVIERALALLEMKRQRVYQEDELMRRLQSQERCVQIS